MIPEKLKKGSNVRVIAPSSSLHIISLEQRRISTERLHSSLGLNVSYAEHADEVDEFLSSSVAARVEDIHAAFKDHSVHAIMSCIGGHFSNQLLSQLDYELIKKHPKVFCGYSDISALNWAIYAKTGIVTYEGPHFSTFSMIHGLEYTLENFKKCVMETGPYKVDPSPVWSDDVWYLKQEDRDFIPNEGYIVVNPGKAEGVSMGGNLCTINLLQGTPFMPSLRDAILFLEEDFTCDALDFDRNLQSLIHLPEFAGVKALVIGRFQKKSLVSDSKIVKLLKNKPELNNIPVVANANFGHTVPQFTVPVGGRVSLKAEGTHVEILFTEH